MAIVDRWRALIGQLEEVTDVDWRDPTWWGFAGGAMVLDALAGRGGDAHPHQHLYLGANGGPRSDNYMGRDARAPVDAADAIAVAVIRARAALAAIRDLDGTLPEQPLDRVLAWERGWLRPRRAGQTERVVAFATPRGAFVADLSPDTEAAVATALGVVLVGRDEQMPPVALRRIDPRAADPTTAAVAVGVGLHGLHLVQHLHRTTWTRGGGPWLGVGDAPPLEAVTTCHVIVDGYGHARVTSEILARVGGDRGRLIAAARLGLGGATLPVPKLAAPAGAEPLSFAGRDVGEVGGFVEQSYAYGRAIERTFRAHWSATERRTVHRSPTFQVPIAPGARTDRERRKHRVVHGLLALAMRDGGFESLDEFRARLRPFLERELEAGGILPRLSLGAARAPLPMALRRRLLQSRTRARRGIAPFEVLAGRGRFSSMKFAAGEQPPAPLYAVSSPTLLATPEDPLGAVVLSLIHHADGVTATAAGTGVVGSNEGAAAFLDTWCEELDIVRAHGRRERSSTPASGLRGD